VKRLDLNKTNANENGPSTLQSQTGRLEIVLNQSIPQETGNIPTVMDSSLGIDSFTGTVRDFRSYLKGMRRLLKAEIIW
jgi:hypothetical protein